MEFRARWYQKAFHQALVGDDLRPGHRGLAPPRRQGRGRPARLPRPEHQPDRDLLALPAGICPGPQGALDRDQRPHRQAPHRRDLPARMPRDDARAGDVHPVQMGQHLAADRLGRLRRDGRGRPGRDRLLGVGARQPERLGLPPPDAGGEPRQGRLHHHAARQQPRQGDARHGEGEPALVRRGAERGGHRRAVAAAARRGAGRVPGALRHRLRPRLLRAGVPLQLLRRDGRRLLRGRDGAGRARGPGGRGAGRRAVTGCTRSGTWGAR